MYKSEQLEVTQGFVCPKEEYAAFCTWAKNTLPFIDTPSVASHLFGAWIGSARHRLTTEARMAEAVEAERARCSKLAADYAASMKPTVILGDDDSIYLTDHEQGQKDAAKRLSIMIYETAIRSQSNG